jgi:hypothetical protein
MDEVMDYMSANLNPKEFLRASKESEALVAQKNAQEKPFRAKDGLYYIQKWDMSPDGRPKRGHVVPYKERVAATEDERVGFKIKATEKAIGEKLTPQEIKQVRLGIKPPKKGKVVTPSKQRKEIEEQIKFYLSQLGRIGVDEDLGEAGREPTVSDAFEIIAKSETGEEIAPRKLKTAKKIVALSRQYDAIDGKQEDQTGLDWRLYRQRKTETTVPLGGYAPPRAPRRTPVISP